MFEAVGEAHWQTFFDKVRDLLAPGGLAALQVILIDEARFDLYRRSADFIQRYVFPGGMLPSPGAFTRAAEIGAAEDRRDLPFRARLRAHLVAVAEGVPAGLAAGRGLGFDTRFKRLWEYYLAYCEGGFRAGSIDVAQFRLVKP